ncbi:chemotaxis protein [Nitratireductor kimnyeongensis]|uniref:Chemotaxis protein n=1 Tax=Nitratireductor kimnyeongensis TaxID=430679 RepID=A0ABW0T7C5_9HYPH|nr:chemotaxis protein [Nitratireductor kimnyeongensis]QZZ36242.1 chemotaxis protein [Nitratireductor kimnyeongensis]
MRAVARFAAILFTGLVFETGAQAASMQPYQMVRSLQRVQDRIAGGDHAALPMQQKLLGIIDNRIRKADPEDFSDPRNLQALLIYGLSGGNPKTLELLFSKLTLGAQETRLGEAIVRYAHGDFTAARSMLQEIDPKSLPPEVGPPVALVSATVTARDNPLFAIRMLDEARLLSPGTLIEEAALRRSIPLAAALKDTQRLARASEQYVRRFLRSPYATQFVDTFVAAVVELHDTVDPSMVDEVTAQMSDEQARIVYLRLARKSAIEGYERLLAFASQKAMAYGRNADGGNDPRAVLYANMASVSSDNVNEVLVALTGIDRHRLSKADQELLDASVAIAKAVLDEPRHTSAVAMDSEPELVDARLPDEEFSEHDNKSAEIADSSTSLIAQEAAMPVVSGETVHDEADSYLKEMRSKLDDIDALLGKEPGQ